MKKLIFSKYRQYFFISFALLFLTTVVFLFTNKSSLYNSPTESNEEFSKEINNFFSFFVNNNDAIQNKKTIKIKSGDSIQRILLKEGIPQSEINKIYSKIIKKYDLKKIQEGQAITIVFDSNNKKNISRLSFALDNLSTAHLYANQDDYDIKIIKKNLEKKNFLAKGVITNSLYNSASKAGVDPEIIIEFSRIFGFEIDFQRDIRENDEFQILYERFEDDDGEVQKNGEIIFAYMNNNGKEISLYRFKDQKNNIGYYSKDGKSIEKALMKTPINGARLSSSFGLRKHPILGYNKLHQGTDFAAPKGTPIMASGSGTIEMASWNGAYGKYVRIRHNSTYKTAYAHLSRFGKNIRRGAKVQQGQIIGYVGSTGRSTGPHLHYEVLIKNKRVNSQNLKLPSGKNLTGNDFKVFEETMKSIDELKIQIANNS